MSKHYIDRVDWSYFNKFDKVSDKYLPTMGEGETKATQIVTAVSKLVYKWYNDGDVYDNQYTLKGWCNDLSSYANWLYTVCDYSTECGDILCRISECYNEADYEHLLKDLADTLLGDEEWLDAQNQQIKLGTIYKCNGPFIFEEELEDEDEEWW